MFFHGTTTALDLHPGDILLPARETGILRETWRTHEDQFVFLTDSQKSAKAYAHKAARTMGGSPVVLTCTVDDDEDAHHIRPGEYVIDKAYIIDTHRIK